MVCNCWQCGMPCYADTLMATRGLSTHRQYAQRDRLDMKAFAMTIPDPQAPPAAEFDNYATAYNAGMDSPVKALLGDSADEFVAVKVRWLMQQFPTLRTSGNRLRMLDYGCGTATLLRLLAPEMPAATLMGCDISAGMLAQAKRSWPAELSEPTLHLQNGALTPLPSASCDLIVISAVLHHVPIAQRHDVYAEIKRLLRPGGRLVVFEHNPLNPVTRYVVAHTPIDQNAILLRAREVETALNEFSFDVIRTSYLMFVPPRLRLLASVERLIAWLPLGAQYATTACTKTG
jgi:ubiquinone/menaquinone biosynthesis C-methylase UbiE